MLSSRVLSCVLIVNAFLETLRKYPVQPELSRVTQGDYIIHGTDFTLERGISVLIPVRALHNDPEIYPNPEKFDPDRFLEPLQPHVYMPFGSGPRNCIANRFVIMQTKALVYSIVKEFALEMSEKSTVPLKLASGMQMKPEKGFWLNLRERGNL